MNKLALSQGNSLTWIYRDIMSVHRDQTMAETLEQERELFWELLAPLHKKLYNFLHKALHFSEDSGDLFQEVVVRAFRYFTTYDRQRSFSTWLFTIAHNEIKKYFKIRRDLGQETSLSLLPVDPPAAETNPDVEMIYGVAGRLPLKQREVFFLFYYNGFSITEVAAVTGLSEGNVKFILNRCREAIKRELEVGNERK